MRRVVPACAALLLLTACRVETTLGIEVGAGGTGRVRVTVVLDRDAADRAPDLGEQLRVDDLRAAGWQVDAPEKTDRGGRRLEAVKRFRTPAEAEGIVEELTGPDGPLRHFQLQRDRSFLRTRTAFSGTVDLSRGVESFSDEELRRRLGGSALGFDPPDLERRLGTPLAEVFVFEVVARLPGEDPVVWRPRLGERIELAANAEQWNVRTVGSSAVALGAAAALVAVLLRRHSRRSA